MTTTLPIVSAVLRRAGAILVATLLVSFAPSDAAERRLSSADRRVEAGAAAFQRGAFESAVAEWKSAAESFQRKRETPALIDTLAQLASAYHALGQHRLAVEVLDEAVALARESSDRPRLISALSSLGAINTFSREAGDAEKTLREALALARKEGDAAALGSVQNNLGNLLAAQERFSEARAAYREAIAHTSGAAAAKARVNLARMAVASGDFAQARTLNTAAIQAAQSLPDSHDKAFALLRAGQTWEELFENAPAHEQRRRLDALHAYQQAARAAEVTGDDRALSFALGYTGRLYEQEKKFAEAMRLTNRALFLAQKIQSQDVLYQWEWQMGRILRAQGRRDDAIAACQRAVELLKNIRTDLSTRLGNSNARSSFREKAGGVYFDLADLLLQRADDLTDEAALRDCLIEARDACEQLKTVELEDYFQDDCVNLLKKKRETIEDILQSKGSAKEQDKDGRNAALEKATRTTAVVYIIPLHDRTETLISLPGGLRRVKSRATVAQITETVRAFREHLEKRTTSEYLAESWQLYDWLIRPLETLLEQNKIDTLVFVPDGALRTIPMAALNDRQNFLIEKYSIAITPGLTLMEPRPIARTNMTVMASGLSDSVQGYQALPFVVAEMNRLKELFNPDIIMNRDFAPERLVKEFAARPYSIVHIASHGEFSSDVKKTFVLTYNSRFTLDALEKLLSPTLLRKDPVEMLTLSACQTAAGDDRAALGLGGIAVKAGARSAFATLWNVNDQASTTLVGDFYTTLRDQPQMSKAQALRKAQVALLKDERFSHPCLWAPYLIIGNWL